MDKRTEFSGALKAAMRDKDQVTVSTVRLILAALKDRDIAARTQGRGDSISDDEILTMLQGMIKQRRESAQAYRDGKRPELAAREEAEIAIIEQFLPRQMEEDEICAAIDKAMKETEAAVLKDMGRVMAFLREHYAGRMDMGRASGIVKEKLAA